MADNTVQVVGKSSPAAKSYEDYIASSEVPMTCTGNIDFLSLPKDYTKSSDAEDQSWLYEGKSPVSTFDIDEANLPQLLPPREKSLLEGGKYKNDVYYTPGCNNHQALHTFQTDCVKTPFGNYSAAIGADYKLDDGDEIKKTVLDLYSSHPLNKYFSINGRWRTNYSEANPTTQARLGLNFSLPLTDNLTLVNQVYGKGRLNFHGRHTGLTFGNFLDAVYKINDKWSIIGEIEPSDLSKISTNNIIDSIGVRYNLGN